MSTDAYYLKLTQIFRDLFDDDSLIVTPELTARDVSEWDSLNHIRLIMAIEKAFGLKFTAAEVQRLKNVGEFVALIERKSAA
jgi:acyl carrier protein